MQTKIGDKLLLGKDEAEVKDVISEDDSGGKYLVILTEDDSETEIFLKTFRVKNENFSDILSKLKKKYEIWKTAYDASSNKLINLHEIEEASSANGEKVIGLSTEFMKGGNLQDLFRKWSDELEADDKPFSRTQINELFNFFESICEAVYVLHKRNFIHEDINPTNIFFDSQKIKCKLGIPNLFYDVNEKSIKTDVTSSFMAPEVRNGNFTKASDIFALGTTFYYCLSGNMPFNNNYSGKLKFLKDINANISSELAEIIQKCLKFSPDERPVIEEVIEELNRFNRSAPQKLADLIKEVLGNDGMLELINIMEINGYGSRSKFKEHSIAHDLIEEYCNTTPPDEILREHCTHKQLINLSLKLDIETKGKSRQEMIQAILLKVGFFSGPKIISSLEKIKIQIENHRHAFYHKRESDEYIGIVQAVCLKMEQAFEIYIKFYGNLRFGDEFESKIIANLKKKKKFAKFSFGDKLDALRECCQNKLSSDIEDNKKFESLFNKAIIENSVFDSLNILVENRNRLQHNYFDVEKTRRIGRDALDKAYEVIEALAGNNFAPRIVQILSREIDYYSRRFYFGKDGQGRKERILSSVDLEVGKLYLIFPFTTPERINPIIFPFEQRNQK